MKWWGRARLRTKIHVTFSLLVFVLLGLAFWFIRITVDRQVDATLDGQLREIVRHFERQRENGTEKLRIGTTQLARDHALKSVVATYDAASLQAAVVSFRERVAADLFWITDDAGLLLADSSQVRPANSSVSSISPLAAALARGETADAISEVGGRLFQMVAVPVLAPDVIGFVVAGEEIDDTTAKRLVGESQSDISFLTEDQVFASSLPPKLRLAEFEYGHFGGGLLPSMLKKTFIASVQGERFQLLLDRVDSDLSKPVYLLVQRSYDRALEPWAKLQLELLAAGLSALALALLVGAWLARGITRPVQKLVGVMHEVLEGDLSQTVSPDREDEIGYLTRTFNEMVSGLRDRARIRDAFGRFVSRDVAEEYLAGRIPLEGERREVTILFQDLRGFTEMGERMEPEQMRRILNRIITEMVGAVENQGGTVKQFTGDGLMAIFGAPKVFADHPTRAVRAGLDMIERMTGLNEIFEKEGLEVARIGVGIHTGEVVAGPFGPDKRVEYAVVGDATNLASRIEGLTKQIHADLLISEATAARLGPGFTFGRREVYPVKGKQRPVGVVEVLACAPASAPVA